MLFMRQSLVLGGTRGLGLALAQESAARGIQPIAAGRSADNPDIAASLPQNAIRVVFDRIWPEAEGNQVNFQNLCD